MLRYLAAYLTYRVVKVATWIALLWYFMAHAFGCAKPVPTEVTTASITSQLSCRDYAIIPQTGDCFVHHCDGGTQADNGPLCHVMKHDAFNR